MPVALRMLARGSESLRNSEVKIIFGARATLSRRALGQGVADSETGEITLRPGCESPATYTSAYAARRGARAKVLAVSREPHRIDWR
jgi:hypothetical protein